LPLEFIASKKELIFVDQEDSVSQAVDKMREQNIHCVPVWDSKGEVFVGMVDMADIVRIAALGLTDDRNEMNFHELYNHYAFSVEKIGEVVSKSQRCGGIVVLDSGESIANAMRVLVECHHVLVRCHNIFHICSQMDVVKYLSLDSNLGDVGKRKISELGMVGPVGAPTVGSEIRATDAFGKMVQHKVNAVAVVDGDGLLVANLSASDLRGISDRNIGDAMLPVLEFLERQHGKKPPVPVTAKAGDHLEDVLPKLIAARVHQIWITNSAGIPIGIVTLEDIIRNAIGDERSTRNSKISTNEPI